MQKKRTTTKILPFLIGATLLCAPTYALADDEQSSEILQQKKVDVEQQIEAAKLKIEQMQQMMNEAIAEFDATVAEIKQLTEEMAQLELKMEQRGVIIEERLKTYQSNKSNFTIYLDAVFRAETIADILGRISSVNTILDADQDMLEQYEKEQVELQQLQQQLQQLNKEQEALFKQLQQEESDMQLQQLELEATVLELQAQIAEAEERERLERERAVIEQQLGDLYTLGGLIVVETVENPPEQAANIANGVEKAKQYLGMPYFWGGMHPSTSFDCSGLIQWSYGQEGIAIPRTAAQQFLASVKIDVKDVLPGDLVFFSYGKGIQHVGIYVGNGMMLNSQNAGVVIEKISGWKQHLAGFGRVVN